MRILVISAYYPPDTVGGYEWACHAVVTRLADRGHGVRVLTGRSAAHAGTDETVAPVFTRIASGPSCPEGSLRFRGQVLLAYLRNYHAILGEARRFRPDVIYLWAGANLTPAVVAACETSGVPLVFHFEDDWLLKYRKQAEGGGITRPLRRLLAGVPQYAMACWTFVYVSQALRDQYERAGVTGHHATVVHNGYEPRRPPRRWPDVPPPAYHIGYAGRLRENKGVHLLLDALASWDIRVRPDVALSIYGTGDPAYEECLKAQVRGTPLEYRVRWIGRQPRETMLAAYTGIDLLVVPSIWEEPFGLVAIEAMACGVPVLATRRGGLVEVVDDACGWLCNPEAASLRAALEDALADYPRLARKGQGGPRRVAERFAWEDKVDAIEAALRQARAAKGCAPPDANIPSDTGNV